MKNVFQLTQLATRISVIVGSSVIISAPAFANSCTVFSADGVCGLKEYQMTSPFSPVPTAWYFTSPTQETAINGTAKAQNIYFASGTSARNESDIQQLLVDGANLNGYYINASKAGTAHILLANKASVDWIEAGGALTHTQISVDNATLNGADADINYDQKDKNAAGNFSKNYARGNAIYLSPGDNGNTDIDITNGSSVHGRILAGGAGTHDITLQDSVIEAGSVLLYNASNDNTINVLNSKIDTTHALLPTENAIEINNTAHAGKTNTISLVDSELTGSLAITSAGGTNSLSVNNSTINGNIIANQAAQTAMEITRSVLNGSIDINGDTATLKLDDSTVSGDIRLDTSTADRSEIWLNNSDVQGHLYGNGQNSTLHLAGKSQFNGTQFSKFSDLNVAGNVAIAGGFTNDNVGQQLTVKGETLTAPIQLSSGKLAFDATKIIANTLSLKEGASLALTNHSQLQTQSDRLFKASASAALPGGYTDTGARITFKDSTLVLTDADYQLEYVQAVNNMLDLTQGNSLVMLGVIRDPQNAAGTASVIDAATTKAVLANTQVTSSKNKLTIGAENSVTDDRIAVSNGFGAAQLRFEGNDAPSIEIVGNQALTLTGAAGGALFDVVNAPDAEVNVAVTQGTFSIGSSAIDNITSQLTGSVNVAEKGTMNILAGDHTIISHGAGITSSGLVNIDPAATLHADINLQNNAQLVVNGSLQASQLTASKDAQIRVGKADAAGTLIANALDLQGARMFIDPAWSDGGTLADASRVASGGTEINGRITVGQNALLVLGDTSTTAAEAAFADSQLKWGPQGITAALAIQAPQTLTANQGGLRVDGALTGSTGMYDAEYNKAGFADHSLLMVDAQDTTGGKAALSAVDGTLTVADSAALYVANAKANQTYVVAKGFSDVQLNGDGWQKDNLLLNKLLIARTGENNGEVTVTTRARAAQDVLPGVVTAHALDTLINSGENSRTAQHAGQRFLSVAIDTPQASVDQVVKTVNSAAQIAFAGGVQSNTLAAGASAVNAIIDRNSVTSRGLQAPESDASVWVQTLYGNQRSRDLSAGSMRYGLDSDFYGLMLGADKEYETSLGNMRSGAAFHAGNGDSNSRGDFNSTHNDFSFWGISLYQNWRHNQLSVTGDVSLTESNNDLYQKQPGWMNAGSKLNASVDSRLFSAGLRGEYLIETHVVDLIPYAAVRYNQLVTQSFDTKNKGGENVFHTDKGTQNIWQFPVGVNINKTFALDSGWNLSSQAGVGVTAVTGDRDAKSTLHTVGIRSSDALSAEIIDDTTFNGQAGLKFQKGNMTFGVGYNINASSHDTDQIVSATYKLAF
ncbi:autotransporter outer membrane beta-barrel domain-containing protein [Enterobacter oligotrophicus]|uniref:autotransporter outer membrane beta-barrel domain-containing protein n=1 Tax=Enterobacter oligotrophicus TaxID=2478464 RepID=UPI001260B576|nr:autotransporter outer membrane beta-barrel domain-containing protein [Enterobacter oligotrophicus]